jgi:uncharacterized coiled-coil DUF342 family protein
MMEEDKLITAKKALDEARKEYDQAHSRYENARSLETSCRDTLNEAQKAFDAVVADLKKDAPWDSNWHNQTRSGKCAA